ncbi:STAS domain-containing protein [Streptomyces hundungensis]|uniref:STAS domain-containing protein n=1 Tax=Streptomyces hundungensis TaxID=1077946 RepID=UPI0031EEC264
MTTLPPGLRLVTIDAENTVRIEIIGDLDYQTADVLLDEVTAQLGARPDLKDVHLHFQEIGTVDSMGLSVLLMIHRHTTAAGTRLHLNDRPPNLDRLLDITGTLEYFESTPPVGTAFSPSNSTTASSIADTGQSSRPGGRDTTT